MIIGLPKEIKPQEYRVALTPAGVRQLCQDGHRVLVEADAGAGSGFNDGEYRQAGGELATREALFAAAELLVKVKEPLPAEYELLRPGQALFTYLHLAPNRQLTEALLARQVTALGYETLERDGEKPLLTPMSEIAGRMAPLVGSFYLQRPRGGCGVLPCGASGGEPARALVLGAGVVGREAARLALGIGMRTLVLNRGEERLRSLAAEFGPGLGTRRLEPASLATELPAADLVIGALYATGGRTPLLIDQELLAVMRPGTVLVDVAIDQGGVAVSSHPTTHDDPVFSVAGVLHYCVANMPGAYPRTSTLALTAATLPYIRQLAGLGIDGALRASPELASALNLQGGAVIHPGLAGAR